MRWKSGRRSDNFEDRRGSSPSMASGGGGALLLLFRILPLLLRSKGGRIFLGIVVLVFVGAKMLNVDLLPLLTGGEVVATNNNRAPNQTTTNRPAAEDELVDFVRVVLADTETTWQNIFNQMGRQYREPTLVFFTGAVQSACGFAQAAMGPFYCPADQKVYIDLSFYQDLKNRHGAPGDFAQAYVIAHEVGHHVQTLLGISAQVRKQQERAGKAEANQLSVRQELQADCFAGLWGYTANVESNILDPGDLEEALVAASAIGDDRLQQQARGYAVPESFTHGTSEQRVRWFRKGFTTGDINQCDTFAATNL